MNLIQPVPFKVFETLGPDGRIHRNFITEPNYQYSQTQSRTYQGPVAQPKVKNSDMAGVLDQSTTTEKKLPKRKMEKRNFVLKRHDQNVSAQKS